MKTLFLVVLISFAPVQEFLAQFLRETSSRESARRGIEAWRAKDYAGAVGAFEQSSAIRPGPLSSFDLGSALIAAGDPTRGAAAMEKALQDPAIRALAHYNNGTGALSAKEFARAIQELTEALRSDPNDRRAKRNLEIALDRQREQEEQGDPSPDGERPQDQEDVPRAGDQDEPSDETEAILRSVEQQEREELKRMRRSRVARRPIGW